MLKIDYKFKDESLLRLAMTHSSYANEHHGTHLQCNERLEFLGDSVLGFVTAGYLFTHYPDLPEGDLTKAARGSCLRGRTGRESRTRSVSRKPSVWGTRRWAADASVRPFSLMQQRLCSALSSWTAASSLPVRSCCASSRTRSRLRWQAARSRTTRPCCRRSCRRTSRKRWNTVWQGSPVRTMTSGSRWSCCSTQCVCRGHRQEQRGSRADGGEEGFGKYGMLTLSPDRNRDKRQRGREIDLFFCMTQLVVEKDTAAVVK